MSSIIKVDTIQKADGNTATVQDLGLATDALSNRNIIINGAMQVAQRGTQVTGVTSTAYRTCDRIKASIGTLGTWTVDQSTDAPNGFSNSFKVTCTTADASPSASDYIMFQYFIEAQDLQRLGYGTSGAKEVTLSFYVKSNKTGSASFEVRNQDSAKAFTKSYTVSSADTWERKTITFPADTVNTLNNDNGEGFTLNWWLNSGSDFSGGSYSSGWVGLSNPIRNINNLGVGGATSDYFAITGIQLEVGSVATPFEHRSYAEELARCQRYYIRRTALAVNDYPGDCHGWASTSGTQQFITRFDTTMRAAPSMSSSGNFRLQSGTHDSGWSSDISGGNTSNIAMRLIMASATFTGTNNAAGVLQAQSAGNYVAFDAEL